MQTDDGPAPDPNYQITLKEAINRLRQAEIVIAALALKNGGEITLSLDDVSKVFDGEYELTTWSDPEKVTFNIKAILKTPGSTEDKGD